MTSPNPDFFIETEKLPAFGANTARRLKLTGECAPARAAGEVYSALARVRRAHDRLETRCRGRSELPEAAEWLLDNWYLAQREGKYAAADIRAAGPLRRTEDGPLTAEACGALVRSGGGSVTEERMAAFLEGFQTVCPLSRAELSVFAPFVKAALVTQLAALYAGEDEQSGETAKAAGAVFTSLRLLATLDLSALLERVDLTEGLLRQDPAGVYPRMDERTRDHYRRAVTRLARRAGTNEQRLARCLLDMAARSEEGPRRHVGYWIFTRPMGEAPRPARGGAYIAAVVLPALFLSLLAGFWTGSAAAALLLPVPLAELFKNILDGLLLRRVPPRPVPRMELEGGVPEAGKTVCVISSLLTSAENGPVMARRLEEFRLASRDCGENLLFGLLADLPEAAARVTEADAPAVAAAQDAVEALNKKYGGGFYLFCRRRVYAGTDRLWRGRERKRGALLALARLMAGEESELSVLSGEAARLRGARYILTLDADTRLPPGAARELVGAALHPLNTPVVDAARGAVVSGYGVIHPRMAVELSAATASGFARVYAGQGGTDPYGSACGELYTDLFDRGGFAGKGILDAAALRACTEALPENRILSHDAVEGALLRGGFMSDTELTDGFPANAVSYFRRMHRWTRGDWQNLPFAFDRRLTDIDRWKLFDSVRRSLVAPAALAAFLAALLWPGRGPVVAAAGALAALLSRLLLSLAEARPRRGGPRARYYSTVLHGAAGAAAQAGLRLLLLPAEAWVCASAAGTALWRMTVSRRRLLEWQTAAQSEAARRGGAAGCCAGLWFCAAAGLAALLFSASMAGRAAGLLWLFAPAVAAALGRTRPEAPPVPEAHRAYLTARAAEMWQYFETWCRRGDHFLPPDNWQEQPPVGLAHRTSPTNIGLALLSALVAADLGLAQRDRAMTFIANMLDTVEALPKWNGHLYNWYDTRKLTPLLPRYISTVDSGNFAACLIALRAGAAEYGRADLAERADALCRAMDFSPLYDRTRRLFRIGWDLSSGEASRGLYDLMASEARLTGYLAVARGDVPRRHWRQLSRALVQKDGFRGMASWTGTMFEYLMPELFLPLCPESLLWESAKFCLYVQRRRAPRSLPWGVSESAFFSLDPSLSYRYKAHGCAALALKRGMDEEYVVSPYSSFLALAAEPERAVRNLQALERLGALGRFGFWEAVDFTPARCRFQSGETVRCVMAHHLGMSLVAADNYLCGGRMRRRFMDDPAMAACRGFLEERVPVGGVLLRRRGEQPPEKPARTAPESWEKRGEGTDFARPACCLLSNGAYGVLMTESGLSAASAGGVGLYRGPAGPLDGRGGIRICLDTGSGRLPLLPEPGDGPRLAFSWAFSGGGAVFSGTGEGLAACCSCAVSARDLGEARFVELSAAAPLRGRLVLEFEPMLARPADYEGHPAFWRLGLHAAQRGRTLLLRRLARGELPGAFLCLACDAPVTFAANRDGAPLGWLSAPFVRAEVPVDIPAGGAFSARFALTFGGDEEETRAAALRTLAMGPADFADLPSACAALYGMAAKDIADAMGMVSALAFPRAAGPVRQGREALWRFGISGDYPILCAALEGDAQLPAARALIARHALLRACGFKADLVFLNAEGGDYLRTLSRAVADTLEKFGLGAFSGAPGGVHIADAAQARDCVSPCAALTVSLSQPAAPRTRRTGTHYRALPPPRRGGEVHGRYRADGAFEFFTDGTALPRRAWGNMLTNGAFGFFAADAGTGSLWFKNARENRLNRWMNDPFAVSGPETLEAVRDGARLSLFAAEDGHPARVTFGFGWAAWERALPGGAVRVTAFVPLGVNARVLLVEGAGGDLYWCTDLVLAGDEKDAPFVVTAFENHLLRAENARSAYPDTVFSAVFSAEPRSFTCDLDAWRRGELDGKTGAGLLPCFGVCLPAAPAAVLVCGCCEEEKLRRLAEPEAARAALEETRAWWEKLTGRLRVSTPDAALNHYLNGWGAYQTAACRLMGRCSLYQSGGAYGFRDQLQDAVNLLLLDPAPARRQILAACAHQYEEGDVMHWWHPQAGGDKGVRTRCSDDLVWLPWAVCEYVEKTGDAALLAEETPYLASPGLGEDEESRYEAPRISARREDVLAHAARALAKVLSRGAGAHGLPLMGAGDWNDGMDRVGAKGRGESVWLGWFFAHTARRFAALMERCGRGRDAAALLSAARRFGQAADAAWDGDWYLRGWYDDGAPLGSARSSGCKIDAIAQSWSAFCEEASPERRAAALDAALERLYDREHGLVKLFDPPFGDGSEPAGYIKSYGPGFRENGGQYTHGAIWLAAACLREGRTDEGRDLLRTLLSHRGGAEPFVLPADVYANPDRMGESGWSWYTGSAGWFLRTAAEELLGLRLKDGTLSCSPRLPSDWPGFSVSWTDFAGARHVFRFGTPPETDGDVHK